MGEHEQETGQTDGQDAEQQPQDEQQPADDGGATAGSTGEDAAPQVEGGDEQAVDPVHPPEEATPADETADRTPDGETQTGADPQPE